MREGGARDQRACQWGGTGSKGGTFPEKKTPFSRSNVRPGRLNRTGCGEKQRQRNQAGKKRRGEILE